MNNIKVLEKKGLVNIWETYPNILLDIKYATPDNLTWKILYKTSLCFLHKKAAKSLYSVQIELEKEGLWLKIWDAYRPISVQKKLVAFVNNTQYTPSVSNHSKGISVDLTIINLQTKQEIKMPTKFDDLTNKAHQDALILDKTAFKNREKLKSIMKKYWFTVYPYERRHYDFLKLKHLEPLDIEI